MSFRDALDVVAAASAASGVVGEDGFRVRDQDGAHVAGTVVNAVKPRPQAISAAAEELVRSPADTGLATLHPSGGLNLADQYLHIVGDLTGGASFITSSIAGLAAQASRTAQVLRTP